MSPAGIGNCWVSACPGDREVDDKRLGAALDPAEYALLDDADFARYPFLKKGYIGPKALLDNGVRYLVDPRVATGTSWITGADETGKHVVGLVAGRDFTPDGTIEAAEVRDGDPSPDGAGPLVSARGIEIGHIFQLGRKYTDAFSVDVLGEDGKPVRLTMGSYGVGVSRLVAVIAEQHHDELGLRWPASVSPFDVHVVIANKDPEARAGAEELAAELDRLGFEVLLDDRTVSPGVKFKDAELLGVPWIVVVGRGWADGTAELRNRFSGETREIAVAQRGRRDDRRGAGRAAVARRYSLRRGTPRSPASRPAPAASAPPSPRTGSVRCRRTPGPARCREVCSSTARQATAQSLLHPDRQFGGVGGRIHHHRQLVAHRRQRHFHRPSVSSVTAASRRSRCSASDSETSSLSSGMTCAEPRRSRRSRRARPPRRRTAPPGPAVLGAVRVGVARPFDDSSGGGGCGRG